MNREVVFVQRSAVSHAMGDAVKSGAHRQGNFFGNRGCAQYAEGTDHVVPPANTIDQAGGEHALQQVAGGCW